MYCTTVKYRITKSNTSISNIFLLVITFLFTKLPWPNDYKATFEFFKSSCHLTTGLPHTAECGGFRLFFLMLNVKQKSCKKQFSKFLVYTDQGYRTRVLKVSVEGVLFPFDPWSANFRQCCFVFSCTLKGLPCNSSLFTDHVTDFGLCRTFDPGKNLKDKYQIVRGKKLL